VANKSFFIAAITTTNSYLNFGAIGFVIGHEVSFSLPIDKFSLSVKAKVKKFEYFQ